MIEVETLHRHFGGFRAVDGASLQQTLAWLAAESPAARILERLHPLLSELEALCVESGFGNLRNLDDADLVSCRTVLAEFESRMSIERKQLFTRIDELSDELVQRYRTSSSDVDSLLDEGR